MICEFCGADFIAAPECCAKAKTAFAREQLNHVNECPYCPGEGCSVCDPILDEFEEFERAEGRAERFDRLEY